MEFKTFNEEELNTFSKETIITLYVQLTSSFQILADQNEKLIKQVTDLQESVAILANHRFGRHTEKSSEIADGQIPLDLEGIALVLNEAELITDNASEDEKSEAELFKP